MRAFPYVSILLILGAEDFQNDLRNSGMVQIDLTEHP